MPNDKNELFQLAYTDELTGLYNRRYLKTNIRGYIQKLKKKDLPLCFIMLDIDKFKDVNDTYGHYAGDNLLKGFGILLKKLAAGKAVPIRYAGDEFVVIIPTYDKKAGKVFADKVIEILSKSKLKITDEDKIKISTSIGIASFPKDADNFTDLLQCADAALYKAKENGRAQAFVYPDDKRMLSSDLLSAIFPFKSPVGREKETDYLLNYVLSEIPEFPVITGELGAGKSYLLEWAERRAYLENLQVFNITGYSFWKMQPLAALFSGIAHYREKHIGQFKEIIESMKNDHASLILDRLEIEKSEEGIDAEKMVAAPTEFMLKLLQSGKTILIIDDMQKLDNDTIRFINSFLHQFRKQPCYPIFAYQISRADPTGMIPLMSQLPLIQNRIKPINLSNFKREDIDCFIDEITGEQEVFSKEQKDIIFENSDGRPLLVSETFKHLLISKKLYYDIDRWVLQDLEEQDLKMSLHHIANSKIELLDSETRDILTNAAMIGESFDIKTLSELTDIEETELQELLRQAEDMHIITEAEGQTGDFRFVNVIDINAFTDRISQKEQNKLHQKIAEIQERFYKDDKSRVLGRLMFHLNQGAHWRQAAQLFRTSDTSYISGKVSDKQLNKLQQRTLTRSIAEETPLDDEDLKKAVRSVRNLKIAIMNLKLYPKSNENVKRSIEKVYDDLQYFFTKTEGFTISATRDSLIINGSEPPPKEVGTLAEDIYELFNSMNLKGITFVHNMTYKELLGFLEILTIGKDEKLNWDQKLEEKNIENILPDRKVYVAVGEHRIVMSQDEKIVVGKGEKSEGAEVDPEKSAALMEDYRGLIDDFKKESKKLLEKLKNSGLKSDDIVKLQSVMELISKKDSLSQQEKPNSGADLPVQNQLPVKQEQEKIQPDHKTDQMSAEDIQSLLFDLASNDQDTRAMALARLAKLDKKLPLIIFNYISSTNNLKANRRAAYLIKTQGDNAIRAFLNFIRPGTPIKKFQAIINILDVFAESESLYRKIKELVPFVDTHYLTMLQILVKKLPAEKTQNLTAYIFETSNDEARIHMLRTPEFLKQRGLSVYIKPWLEKPPVFGKPVPPHLMLDAARAAGELPDADDEMIDMLKNLVKPSGFLSFRSKVPEKIRTAALWSLTRLGPKDLPELMKKLIKDKNRTIAVQAKKYLNNKF
ncbi:MAG: diguanylate cyclase [Candidatus Zixiibacteriota bacterium]